MARVTVEDCIDKVDNRFPLVFAGRHSLALIMSSGSQLTVDRINDKNPRVVAREIATPRSLPEDLARGTCAIPCRSSRSRTNEPDTVPLIGSAAPASDADDTRGRGRRA